jgi:hypothetical protein
MRREIESDLAVLDRDLTITAAQIALECESRTMPPVQVVAVLLIGGRDLRAAARDHTWQAAWQKVVRRLGELADSQRGMSGAARRPGKPSPAPGVDGQAGSNQRSRRKQATRTRTKNKD